MNNRSLSLIVLLIIVTVVQLALGKPVWIALLSGFVGAIVGFIVLWAYRTYFRKAS